MADISIRPATPADLREFYGQDHAMTMRAIVMTIDGELVGIGGIAYGREQVQAFTELKPGFEKNKRAMVIATRAIRDFLSKITFPVIAIADEKYGGKSTTLKRCGFKPFCDSQDGMVFLRDGTK